MTYRSLENTIRLRDAEKIRANHEKMQEEVQLTEHIVNSNSSGQGHDTEHANHPHHDTILKHGYRYSHSTPVRHMDGQHDANGFSMAYTVNHHTYKHMKNEDKNVSVHKVGLSSHWHTSTSGSGHKGTTGRDTADLDKHLKSRKVTAKPKHDHNTMSHMHEEVPVEEKLTDNAKDHIKTALSSPFRKNKTSGPARALIGLAKSNPKNIKKQASTVKEAVKSVRKSPEQTD